MAAGSIHSYYSVLGYCTYTRIDPIKLDEIIRSNPGLINFDELDRCLQVGEYIPVIHAVWSERDRSKRLEWLRAKATIHVPLIFELGMSECRFSQTIETVKNVTLPLFLYGLLRIEQDRSCLIAPMIDASGTFFTYWGVLAKLMKSTPEKLPLMDMIDKDVILKVIELAKKNLSISLPNPGWFGLQLEEINSPKPPSECAAIREEFITATIKKLEEISQLPTVEMKKAFGKLIH